ncbi:uncharacterized protein LOC119838959 isoform X2 [Zerene cesonia]|uniref:uncharacterized protein LOC119838959 isoform X2 n=1 Tax=Zerene cesonia TaxID=33412 RepID=UPI0018E555A7|nr:uncharacterized protein LOC119838959 isoform X2 [Zerene cesonia]XP_038221044.1 uncharacterized protein LOC119838959 isoform X2 [Zerene cesonia]XP_038221045.1 uncharacterized protein LOC119838959 isoform X2 [Zerene cesonia]
MARQTYSTCWNYFKKDSHNQERAICILCTKSFSRKGGGTTCLKSHLRSKHPDEYSIMCKKETKPKISDSELKNAASDQSDSEQSTTLDPENELWGFFDKEPQNRARCSMCGVVLKRETDTLYKHLKESHSRISENLEFRDNDENYTEVIYLEDPVANAESTESKKGKFDSVKIENPESPKPKRPKRRYSYKEPLRVSNSHNIPTEYLKKDRISPHDEEIENFGRYITGLLKAVPQGTCTRLQMDIVNLIMSAKLKSMEPTPTITINGTIEVQGDKADEDGEPVDDMREKEAAEEANLECTTNDRKLESKKEPDKSNLPRKRKSFTYVEDISNIKQMDQEEVENFGKYITCLLKSVSNKDVGTKLQMDIVSLIMSARLKIMEKSSVLTISGTIAMSKDIDSVAGSVS